MRIFKSTVFVASLLVLLLAADLQAKEWRGIIPLKSTRADVERLLGLPNERGRYQFEEERANIDYAEGACDEGNDNCLCFTSEDVVIGINVTLEVEMRFSKLKIDKAKYERFVFSNDPLMTTYSNEEEGVIYTVDEENDDVTDIQYLPSAAVCKEIKEGRSRSIQPRAQQVLAADFHSALLHESR